MEFTNSNFLNKFRFLIMKSDFSCANEFGVLAVEIDPGPDFLKIKLDFLYDILPLGVLRNEANIKKKKNNLRSLTHSKSLADRLSSKSVKRPNL